MPDFRPPHGGAARADRVPHCRPSRLRFVPLGRFGRRRCPAGATALRLPLRMPPWRTRGRAALTALIGVAALLVLVPPATAAVTEDGKPSAFGLQDSRIAESSGLAASRAHPGIYWTHNDSGYDPTRIYAVDGRTGETVATVTLTGVEGRDLEAISLGPDGDLYVGDIGDNMNGSWPEVWIYRFPEPEELRDMTLTPTRYTVRYEDGPRDAEALMAHPKTGRIYLASKSDKDDAGLYEGPAELVPSDAGVNTFRRTAELDLWVTDGAFSPDGTRLVLRGYFTGGVYAWRADGKPKDLGRLRVPLQQQGESVTFAPDGRTPMLGSEGEGSRVEPVELTGDQLPESAQKDGRSPDGGRDGGGSGTDSASDGDGEQNLTRYGVIFIGVIAVVLGLRSLLRRKG